MHVYVKKVDKFLCRRNAKRFLRYKLRVGRKLSNIIKLHHKKNFARQFNPISKECKLKIPGLAITFSERKFDTLP